MKLCISKSYAEKKVYDRFALDILEGEILCVLGPSGCGKTTLLQVLAGLTDYEGSVDDLPEKVGYIFQEPRLLPNLTVEENLRYVGGRYEVIEKILRETELFECKDKRPKELSGGEKQRVAVARAFLSEAPLLLLDEPFSSLDTSLKIRLAEVFARLWKEKKHTAVFVTHDLEEAWMLAHRVVIVRDGQICLDRRLPEGALPRAYGQSSAEKEEILKVLLEK